MHKPAVLGLRTAAALVYSLAHVVASGIRLPLGSSDLPKLAEHAAPLREHLATARPVHSVHPAQYGPVFFFVMHPLLRAISDPWTLMRALYAIQVIAIAGSFVLVWTSLWPLEVQREPALLMWLAIVWMNFSPLYTIVAQKTVETWELLLVSLALHAHLRQRRWIAGTAIAAAGLIKVLPFAFLFYWLFTDRRTLWRALVALVVLLAVGQYLYGSEMGFGYPARIVAAATGHSYGLTFHENISVKAALAKTVGTLQLPGQAPGHPSGYWVLLEGSRAALVAVAGDVLLLACVALLAVTWLREPNRTPARVLAESSLLAVVVLVVAPNTTVDYSTLALGAISYAVAAAWIDSDAPGTRVLLIGALTLVGGVVPRAWLNRIVMVDAINRWTGYTHFTPSEAYQFYEFPLIGLLLLAIAVWRLGRATAGSTRS